MADDRFDIVLFGATGFIGEFVIEELARVADNKRWAVAARSEAQLDDALQKASKNTGIPLRDVPKIIADVNDSLSLSQMAQKARLVINCVGPYSLHGEPVLQACIENASHYVDISGEPNFLESMQLRYHEQARQKGAYVVGACGFDSIPCEMGLQFTKKNFKGDLNSVDTFAEVNSGSKGSSIHFGTFDSAIYAIARRNELHSIRRRLMPNVGELPESPYLSSTKNTMFYNDQLNAWCIPFIGPDKSVVNRTQYYDYFERRQRPIQVNTYFKAGSLPYAVGIYIWGIVFFALCNFAFTRKLMEKYPKLFTFGFFSHEGPNREQLKNTKFSYWFFGKGWKTRLPDVDEQHRVAPSDSIICCVDGPDPGYTTTAATLVACAMTILSDKDQMPARGGVYPPGAAFENTHLMERLQRRGIKFQVIGAKNTNALG